MGMPRRNSHVWTNRLLSFGHSAVACARHLLFFEALSKSVKVDHNITSTSHLMLEACLSTCFTVRNREYERARDLGTVLLSNDVHEGLRYYVPDRCSLSAKIDPHA